MRNFIEVFDINENNKTLISVTAIKSVSVCESGTFINLGFADDGEIVGVRAKDNYQEVCNKIYYAQGGR